MLPASSNVEPRGGSHLSGTPETFGPASGAIVLKEVVMRRTIVTLCVLGLLCLPTVAAANLDGFLNSVNVEARADLPGFSAKVSAQFGVPVPRVEAVLKTVAAPADAFMVFQLGEMAHKPPETVLWTYRSHKGKGWGVIAKELGIKPGSKEFHALKSGELVFSGSPRGQGGGSSKSQGGGQGKGKGHK